MVNNEKRSCLYIVLLLSILHAPLHGQDSRKQVQDLQAEAAALLFSAPEAAESKIDRAIAIARNTAQPDLYLNSLRLKEMLAISTTRYTEWRKILLQIDSFFTDRPDAPLNLDSLQAIHFAQWGIYYHELGYYQRSLEYSYRALEYFSGLSPSAGTCLQLYSTNQFIAAAYGKSGAYDSAIEVFLNSINYYDCYRDKKLPADYSATYLHITQLYLKKDDPAGAKVYLDKALQSMPSTFGQGPNEKRRAINTYNPIINYYIHSQAFDTALIYLNKALPHIDPDDAYTINTYTQFGDIYASDSQLQHYGKSMDYYQKAKKAYQKTLGEKNYRLAVVNQKMGTLQAKTGRIKEALAFFQESICNLVFDFDQRSDFRADPALDQVIGKTELLQSLYQKARLLKLLHTQAPADRWLEQAFKTAQLALTLIDETINDVVQESERQFYVAQAYPVYELAIDLAALCYGNTRDPAFLEQAFAFSEKSKSLSLREAINKVEILSKVPSDILDAERQLKAEIAKVSELVYKENDPARAKKLAHRLSGLKQEYAGWVERIKRSDPYYFEIRYNYQSLPVHELQAVLLAPGQIMLEYFWGEQELFTIAISKDKMILHRQPVAPLADSIPALRKLTLEPALHARIGNSLRFQQLSHFAFACLVEQPLSKLGENYKKLLVAPDGLLEYLPFEMLDVSPETRPGILSPDQFLLYHFTVSYVQSATLLSLQQRQKGGKTKHLFAGFAPTYAAQPDTTGNPPLAYLVRSGQMPLTGNTAEVKAIAKGNGGRVFLGGEAGEAAFKAQAANYTILHLAMHALANDQQPEFSELLFTQPNPDLEEDGRLHAIELYNMRLQAKLAVLSACSTGAGKMLRGEGILSLGHAFTYTGVPSLVTSHWNADDSRTPVIMTAFYRYLKKGWPKDEALSQAKKDYLAQSGLPVHPFYWAAFTVRGDMSAIEFPAPVWPYAASILGLVFAGLLLRRKVSRRTV